MGGAYRLVLYSYLDVPTGALYPVAANPFSEPEFRFSLEPDQALPSLAPGAVVQVEGTCERGAKPIIHAGDVEIHPRKGLRVEGESRLYAERGEVIVHPAISGWAPSWRYLAPVSLDDLDHWKQRLERNRRRGWWLLIAYVLAFVLWGMRGGFGIVVIVATGGGLAGTVHLWRRARRARLTLARAEVAFDQPGRPMQMQIGWLVGHGDGPLAVAHLRSADAHESDPWTSSIPVVNVTPTVAEAGVISVDVHGDPMTGDVVIRVGDALLWPDAAIAVERKRP